MKNFLISQHKLLYVFTTFILSSLIYSKSYADNKLKDIPDFLLESQAHGNVSLSQFKGKVVLINFWATWCRPCRVEMPTIEHFYKQHKESGFEVLAINVEDARNPRKKMAIDKLTKDMNLSFPILYDSQKLVVKNIEKSLLGKNMGLPTSIFIDKNGKTRYLHQGYRRQDEATYQRIIDQLIKEPLIKINSN